MTTKVEPTETVSDYMEETCVTIAFKEWSLKDRVRIIFFAIIGRTAIFKNITWR